MVVWLVHFEGRLDGSWLRVSGGFAPLAATNGDDDDTYSCAQRQGATDQRKDATTLPDAPAL